MIEKRRNLILYFVLLVPFIWFGWNCSNPNSYDPENVIQVYSSDTLVGMLGKLLPEQLIVRVQDNNGNPVYNNLVHFVVTTDNADLGRDSCKTDLYGLAYSWLEPTSTAGQIRIIAYCNSSDTVEFNVNIIDAIELRIVSPAYNIVKLEWSHHPDNNFIDYRIMRNDSLLSTISNPDIFNYIDTSIIIGEAYNYRIFADYNNSTNIGDSITVTAGLLGKYDGVNDLILDSLRDNLLIAQTIGICAVSLESYDIIKNWYFAVPQCLNLSLDNSTIYFVEANGSVSAMEYETGNIEGNYVLTSYLGTFSYAYPLELEEVFPGILFLCGYADGYYEGYIARIDRNATEKYSILADSVLTLSRQVLVNDLRHDRVYAVNSNRVLKLDIAQSETPIIDSTHYRESFFARPAINHDGSLLYMSSGEVFNTSDWSVIGDLSRTGYPQLVLNDSYLLISESRGSNKYGVIALYNATTCVKIDSILINANVSQTLTLPGDSVLLIRDNDTLYGINYRERFELR